jgi:hypothetical protein
MVSDDKFLLMKVFQLSSKERMIDYHYFITPPNVFSSSLFSRNM